MAKDIYKTFKRSVSGIVSRNGINEESSSGPSTSSNLVKYKGGTGRTWIHPPDYLINGHVCYVARFLGSVETPKENGAAVAREAIHAIRFQRDLKRSEQSRETAKLQKVDIEISIDHVRINDAKTKTRMFEFQLGKISFCADDKDDKRMFSFIARGANGKPSCFAFTSEKLAEDITCSIGEAFDLAYKRYLDRNRVSLENERNTYVLQKRIVELENENQKLATLLQQLQNPRSVGNDYQNSIPPHPSVAPPALPLSPMPQGPPPSLSASSSIYSMPRPNETAPTEMAPRLPPISTSPNGSTSSPSSTSPSGPAPSMPPPRPPASLTPPAVLAPPPPVAPRRNLVSPKNSTAGQLEGLDLGEVKKTNSNVFDDSFDPRAGEKKSVAEDYNPFGADFLPGLQNGKTTPPSAAAALLASEAIARLPGGESSSSGQPKKTAADYDAMINEVEKKLAAMNNGSFEFGQLQTGDLDGIEAENAYGTPSDHLNPKMMNLKE